MNSFLPPPPFGNYLPSPPVTSNQINCVAYSHHCTCSPFIKTRTRLDARTLEFDRLRGVQLRDARENEDLKNRLQEMQDANSREKAELEAQMSRVIHSQAGELATQRKKLSSLQTALQEELAVSQNKIAEQEKEINWLKRCVELVMILSFSIRNYWS